MTNLKAIYIFIVLILVSCNNENQSNTTDKGEQKKDSSAVKPEIKGDFTVYEHDLSMYNERYLMRITPDSTHNQYESNILLIKQTDTIFNKRINIDSLGQTILKYKINEGSAEYGHIATDYELRKVKYYAVRTNDLYFIADIASTEGKKDLEVLFQLSYLGKNEIGKLFVNGFNEKGWGKNIEQEFTLKTPDTLALKKLFGQTDYYESMLYLYLKRNYQATSEKDSIEYSKEKPNRICSFHQTFENEMQYYVWECSIEGGLRESIEFPKVELETVRNFIELLFHDEWNTWVSDYKYEPDGAGCYYQIEQEEKSTIIDIYCGC